MKLVCFSRQFAQLLDECGAVRCFVDHHTIIAFKRLIRPQNQSIGALGRHTERFCKCQGKRQISRAVTVTAQFRFGLLLVNQRRDRFVGDTG